MLLLWSCTGITCCLALLGVFCDPHLDHSWYFHRIRLYKRPPIKENTNYISNNLTLIENSDVMSNFTKEGYQGNGGLINLTNEVVTNDVTEWSKNVVESKEDGTLVTPMVLLSIMLFLYNIGLGSVPYVLISELFSINVRSLASSLIISWMWLSSFLLLRYYGSLAVTLGLHGTYYISASITLLGAGYIFLALPETKGKSQEQIDNILEGPFVVVCKERL